LIGYGTACSQDERRVTPHGKDNVP
jgi:hypothetical protein